MTDLITIRDMQAAAWQNKIKKGFNTTDIPLEFCFMQREAGEAFNAWRKGLFRTSARSWPT